MTRPQPAARNPGNAACVHRKAPVRLIAMTRSHSSRVMSSTAVYGNMPACVHHHMDGPSSLNMERTASVSADVKPATVTGRPPRR